MAGETDQYSPDVEAAVVKWLREELDDPEVSGGDNFLDIGAHSLTFSKLNTYLADSFGIALDARSTYEGSLGDAVSARRPLDSSVHQ